MSCDKMFETDDLGRRFVGYWRDHDESDLPNPSDFIGPMDNREQVAAILALGDTFTAWMGYAGCRICGASLGTRCLTLDGTWVWPERLEHYVIEHGLALPPEFVDHLLFFPLAQVAELERHRDAHKEIEQRSTSFDKCPDNFATCDHLSRKNSSYCADHSRPNFSGNFCYKLYEARRKAFDDEQRQHEAAMASTVKIPW